MVSNEQRRRQLAREKFRRQQQRRAAARHRARRRNVVVAIGLAVVLAAGAAAYATVGLGGGDDERKEDAAAPSASPPSAAPDPCDKPAGGSVKEQTWSKEPPMTVDRSASYTMALHTTCGDITIGMDVEKAPHTVNSFAFLAGKGYFDHTRCHRLTDQKIYVLQCGDPKGTGEGDPGYTIPDENLKDKRLRGNVYPAGTVAMANRYNPEEKTGRDSGGSQFFLVYQDSQLPPDYTPFGTVKGGEDVLKKIADAGVSAPDPTTQTTSPNATVVIDKATVTTS